MLDRLRRVAIIFLLFMVLSTCGLYLFANFEAVSVFSMQLAGPVIEAVRERFTEPPTEPPPPTSPPKATTKPGTAEPAQPTEITTGPGEEWGDYVNINSGQAIDSMPFFPFEGDIKNIPDDVVRIIYILGNGSEGNLWLAEMVDGRWRTHAGPLVCNLGSGGLGRSKSDGDSVTPTGWFIPSYLYADFDPEAAWPIRTIAGEYVWVTDSSAKSFNSVVPADYEDYKSAIPLEQGGVFLDIGYNRSKQKGRGGGVFIYGTSKDSATKGAVALSVSDMRRLLDWLDVGKYTAVGIFDASSHGWQIESGIPDGFSILTAAVPGAREDARYAYEDNFMGRPLDGYFGRHVVVSDAMAQALRKAQAMLEERGLGLLVYDSYRPQRAVDDIFAWLANDVPGNKEKYYPALEKSALGGIYLAQNSPHRLGAAVDLTICELDTGEPLDMGTGFDFFSVKSSYNATTLTPEQRENRRLLREIMAACGLSAYESEWWHFNLDSAINSTAVYDFIIPQ